MSIEEKPEVHSNEEDCNEELYREILASSQNRYSHPDLNPGGQLDTS